LLENITTKNERINMNFFQRFFGFLSKPKPPAAKRQERLRPVSEDYAIANVHLHMLSFPSISPPLTGGQREILQPILTAYSLALAGGQQLMSNLPMSEKVSLLRSISEHGASIQNRLNMKEASVPSPATPPKSIEPTAPPRPPTQKPLVAVPERKSVLHEHRSFEGLENQSAKMKIETELIVVGTGNTQGADTEADKRSIIDALNIVNGRYSVGIEPENVRLQFEAYPNKPNDFTLRVKITTTKDEAVKVQQFLVETLGRMGLEV
jgi:hypothetical protein